MEGPESQFSSSIPEPKSETVSSSSNVFVVLICQTFVLLSWHFNFVRIFVAYEKVYHGRDIGTPAS